MSAFLDISGKTFGAWHVIGRTERAYRENGDTLWECICQKCGAAASCGSYDLRKGKTRQCNTCRIAETAARRHGKPFGINSVRKRQNPETEHDRLMRSIRNALAKGKTLTPDNSVRLHGFAEIRAYDRAIGRVIGHERH
ncbi:hypothetical protein [Gluconacetobacter entanii]|uniref:hypothetical protein n=1 Tax=Gluconacetobacter entanii TaxID=108528 RepID=UPI0011B3E37B|nr:hypothetical protein [Gluconacetobacter entanii]